MPADSGKRAPLLDDVMLVLVELERHDVRYALLGGIAMALHGFPRMTKDIDCIFPRDADNNARLMDALTAIAGKVRLDYMPEREWLDKGYSTAAEGEIGIDILFVAASKEFGEYEPHIEVRDVDGVRVNVLDIDGMLMSKATGREEDIADRNRLLRLKE